MLNFHCRDLSSSPGGAKFHGTFSLVLSYYVGEIVHFRGDVSSGVFGSKSKHLTLF